MLPWLLPLGLLGTAALASLSIPFGAALVAAWGWLVFPAVALHISSRSRSRPGTGTRDGLRDVDTQYWRTRPM
jgi:hypothetical protein